MNSNEWKIKWEWVAILLGIILVLAFCMHP